MEKSDIYECKIKQFNEQLNTYYQYILLNNKERIKMKLSKNYSPKLNTDYRKFLTNIREIFFTSTNKGMIAVAKNFKENGLFLSRLYYELVNQWGIEIEKPLSYTKEEDKVMIELIEVFVNKLLEVEIVTNKKTHKQQSTN